MAYVSLVLAAKNRAAFILENLEYLRQQRFTQNQVEVVVVDDRSTDGTLERIRKRDYPFVLKCLRIDGDPATFAAARARNVGFAAASGDIIISLDSDVMVGPDFVAAHLRPHEVLDGSIVVIGYTYGTGTDRTPESLCPPPAAEIVQRLPELLRDHPEKWADLREALYRASPRALETFCGLTSPWCICWSNNFSFPRSLYQRVGGFDEDFTGWGAEDVEFPYRLFRAGARFCVRREAWGIHYPHPIPDEALQRSSHSRNLKVMLAKHPRWEVEVEVWRKVAAHEPVAGVQLGTGEVLRIRHAALDAVRQPGRGPMDAGQVSRTVAALREGGLVGERYAWFGPQEAAPKSHPPATISDAWSPDGAVMTLLGLSTPWQSSHFEGVVLFSHPACSPECLAAICAELARVGSRVVVLREGGEVSPLLQQLDRLGLGFVDGPCHGSLYPHVVVEGSPSR